MYYAADSQTLVVNVPDETMADEIAATGADTRLVDHSVAELNEAKAKVDTFAVPGTAWAIDPVAKAVAPRFWAAVLTVPMLVAFFSSFAIAASWFQGVQILGIDNGMFWQAMKDAVDFYDDFLTAFLKAAVFGGTAALVASYVGFHAEPTIEGTSVATTRAVVNASLLVLMFNFVLSAFLFR
jgi:ABC transport permease subunit